MQVCRVCGNESQKLFTAMILRNKEVDYFKCFHCGVIQTESPYWLEEAYSEAITATDVGLVSRNLLFSKSTSEIIVKNFDFTGKFLDYGGGYGLFVRLMRDAGFDFYWFDEYCRNIFSAGAIADLNSSTIRYELVTCFEVAEHVADPVSFFQTCLNYSDSILFSTVLQPDHSMCSADDWWYFAPEIGQHISFYTQITLQKIAEKLQCNFYTDGSSLHLITKKVFSVNPFSSPKGIQGVKIKKRVSENMKQLKSLTPFDYETARNKIV